MVSQIAVFFVLLLLSGRGGSSPAPSPRPAPGPGPRPSPSPAPGPVTPADYTPAPWPQVVPAGLPAFPSNGWKFDTPPSAAVQSRARQLLAQLWSAGPGTFKTEQTAGRWTTYMAALTKKASGETTKGVVAYRLASEATSTSAPASPNQPTNFASFRKGVHA